MVKNSFKKSLLLRAIPLFVFLVATIVLKVANVFPADWAGWYVAYVLVFLSMAYVAFYGVKNGRSILISSVKKSIEKKAAQYFVDEWDKPQYSKQNIVGYIYQNERNFDRTILFEEEKMTVEQVVRDAEDMVTGEKNSQEYSYQSIKSLSAVDIGSEGCVHIQITFSNDVEEYAYFDVDLAKFLMEKSQKQIANIDQLKTYYISVLQG